MVAKKTVKNDEFEDQKMAIRVELKSRIENAQKMLIDAIGEDYVFSTRQVQAVCTDIEDFKRIMSALEDVKL